MPVYTIKLIAKKEVASSTTVFTFEKPAGLNYTPGQYAGFTLINPPETDAGGITRRFSLLSTPDDNDISIVTRIQNSAFKRVLNQLPMGSEMKFAGPTGNFVLHDDSSIPAVLIAGGVGIAPFYCMIKYATKHRSLQQIYLFYGNQQIDHAAFLDELKQFEEDNPHFTLIATMDKPNPSWSGETGFISDTMIKKYIPDIVTPIYYICGSPAMVTAIQETLVEMGIDENHIFTEDFPGY